MYTTVFTRSYSTSTLINNRRSGALDGTRPALLQLDLSTDRFASAVQLGVLKQAGWAMYLRHCFGLLMIQKLQI